MIVDVREHPIRRGSNHCAAFMAMIEHRYPRSRLRLYLIEPQHIRDLLQLPAE